MNNIYVMKDDKQCKETIIDLTKLLIVNQQISNSSANPKKQRLKQYLTAILPANQPQLLDQTAQTISKSEQSTKQLIEHQLRADDIACQWDAFFNELEYSITHYTSNYEVIRLNVKYAHYSLMINIILVDKMSPSENLTLISQGRYGKVYKAFNDGAAVAIKKICTKQCQFLDSFRGVLKQYSILKIASALQIGPKTQQIYGFDIVLFRDCLQFSMQLCESIESPSYEKLLQIKSKLLKLHSAKLIHCDIKPNNISYSTIRQQYVLIDFGLSRAIRQDFGERTYSGFIGSLQFCSPEMGAIFIGEAKQFIDLYSNDAYALNKTIKVMQMAMQPKENSNQLYYQLQENLLFNFYNLQRLIHKKGSLYNAIFNRKIAKSQSISDRSFDNNQQIAQFLKLLPINENIYNIDALQLLNQSNLLAQRCFHRYSQQSHTRSHSSSRFKDAFYLQLWLQITNISTLPGLNTLTPSRHKSSYPSIYILNLARFIKINGLTDDFSDKILACRAYLTSISFPHAALTPVEIYCSTVSHIWRDIFTPFDALKADYLAELIQTVIMLQLVSEEQLIADITSLVRASISLVHKIHLLMKFTYSFNYISQKYISTYSKQITQKLYSILSQFVASCKQRGDLQINKIIIRYFSEIAEDRQATAECFTIIEDLCQRGIAMTHCEESILELMQMHKCLKLVCLIIRTGQLSDNTLVQKIFKKSVTIFYKDNCITPLQSQLFFLSSYANPSLHHKITFQFSAEVLEFKQGRQFYIYFGCRLMELIRSMTSTRIQQRNQCKAKTIPQQTKCLMRQILNILSFMDESYQLYFNFVDSLINLIYSSQEPTLFRQLLQFFKDKILKFITLLQTMDSQQIHFRRVVILVQISVIYNIVSILGESSAISRQQYSYLLSSFTHSCQLMLQTSSCLCCKSAILLQCRIFMTRRLMIEQKIEPAMALMSDIVTVYLKHNELRRKVYYIAIDLVLMWAENNDVYNKYNVLYFICQIIKQLKLECICLFETRKHSLLESLYGHIALIYEPLQFSDFIGSVLKCLHMSLSSISELYFYCSIVYTTKYITPEVKLDFKIYHNQVISHLLSHKAKNSRLLSQYILYFSALLQIYVKSCGDQSLLKIIAINLDSLNPNCKKLILSQHYYQYVFYVDCPKRKSFFLSIKHYRKTNAQYSQKFFLKKMIKKNTNPHLHKRFLASLGSKIIRCHRNIGNLKKL